MSQWHDEGNGVESLWIGNGWLVRVGGAIAFVPWDPDRTLAKP